MAQAREDFHSPGDDTIYIAQQCAADLHRGVLRGLPGERAGYGQAAGDFAVAYVLAHEYAHNLQQELGTSTTSSAAPPKPYELQADCLAGPGRTRASRRACCSPATSRRRRTRPSPSATSTSATPSIMGRRRSAGMPR